MPTFFLIIKSYFGETAFAEYDDRGVAAYELNRLPFAVRILPSDKLSQEELTLFRKQIIGEY